MEAKGHRVLLSKVLLYYPLEQDRYGVVLGRCRCQKIVQYQLGEGDSSGLYVIPEGITLR